MKKIKFLIATLIVVFYSCENDGGDSVIEYQNGAVPNITKTAGTDQGINVLSLNSGGDINIGLTVGVGQGDVASMEIIGFYTKGSSTERGVLKTGINTFPSQVNITKADLFNAFTSVNSPSDVSLSDKLLITAELTLKNGNIVKIYRDNGQRNYGADIFNSAQFKVFQEYIVSCPLTDASLFNGIYKVIKDDWADYPTNATVPVVYNASNGTFKFKILNSNNPSCLAVSLSEYIEVTVNPVNNTVTASTSAPFDYGAALGGTFGATGTGSVGSCTGEINLKMNWSGAAGSSNNNAFNLVKVNL